MVINGIIDTSSSNTLQLTTESNTYEATVNKFYQWCSTTNNYALHSQNADRACDNLIVSAINSPIPASGCLAVGDSPCRSDVTSEEILSQVQDVLWGVAKNAFFPGWAALSVAVEEAIQGNATLLSAPIINTPSNSYFPFLSITCKD